ncbi:hypothetical protein M5K25_027422 [Dendrobium thyrsiflorum]|uniref:Uncharacterized protein n=1 Tax=Dendrobium thyrsiflorum TaxID=117978 RepID=A0ABD0U067_DENTH
MIRNDPENPVARVCRPALPPCLPQLPRLPRLPHLPRGLPPHPPWLPAFESHRVMSSVASRLARRLDFQHRVTRIALRAASVAGCFCQLPLQPTVSPLLLPALRERKPKMRENRGERKEKVVEISYHPNKFDVATSNLMNEDAPNKFDLFISLRVKKKVSQCTSPDVLIFHGNICEYDLIFCHPLFRSICNGNTDQNIKLNMGPLCSNILKKKVIGMELSPSTIDRAGKAVPPQRIPKIICPAGYVHDPYGLEVELRRRGFINKTIRSDCMGDPNMDHGFSYDDQGRVDVLHSPFFDVAFGNDTTADEYVKRVLYQLTLTIEDQLPANRWCLVSRRPSSPNPATSPTTSTRGIPLLLVASLLVASLLLRPFV